MTDEQPTGLNAAIRAAVLGRPLDPDKRLSMNEALRLAAGYERAEGETK